MSDSAVRGPVTVRLPCADLLRFLAVQAKTSMNTPLAAAIGVYASGTPVGPAGIKTVVPGQEVRHLGVLCCPVVSCAPLVEAFGRSVGLAAMETVVPEK